MISSSRQTPCIITAIAILNRILLSSASSNSHFAATSVPISQHLPPISFMKTFLSIQHLNSAKCILHDNFIFCPSVKSINRNFSLSNNVNRPALRRRSISVASFTSIAFLQNLPTHKHSPSAFDQIFYPKSFSSSKNNHVFNPTNGKKQKITRMIRRACAPLLMTPSQNSHSPNNHNTSEESATIHSSMNPIKVLDRGPYHLVVAKPPAVVCHHSEWTGLRKNKKKNKGQIKNIYSNDETNLDDEEEQPMLQQVRDMMHGRRVNLIHRLDRGASGCLLFSFADGDAVGEGNSESESIDEENRKFPTEQGPNPTAQLIQSLQNPNSIKTYVALVRGEGILHGEDLKAKGWFTIDRPIKDEKGRVRDAITEFRFLAGYTAVVSEELGSVGGGENGLNDKTPLSFKNKSANEPQPVRASLVLARPKTGRWHQIRRHLNGLSHPILGDSTHGNSKINREWREHRNMLGERTCLHLGRVQLVPTTVTVGMEDTESTTNVLPNGLDVACPIPRDMHDMIAVYMPQLLEEVIPLLAEEGITFESLS